MIKINVSKLNILITEYEDTRMLLSQLDDYESEDYNDSIDSLKDYGITFRDTDQDSWSIDYDEPFFNLRVTLDNFRDTMIDIFENEMDFDEDDIISGQSNQSLSTYFGITEYDGDVDFEIRISNHDDKHSTSDRETIYITKNTHRMFKEISEVIEENTGYFIQFNL